MNNVCPDCWIDSLRNGICTDDACPSHYNKQATR